MSEFIQRREKDITGVTSKASGQRGSTTDGDFTVFHSLSTSASMEEKYDLGNTKTKQQPQNKFYEKTSVTDTNNNDSTDGDTNNKEKKTQQKQNA